MTREMIVRTVFTGSVGLPFHLTALSKNPLNPLNVLDLSSKFSGFRAYFRANLVDLVDFLKGHSLKGQSTASMNDMIYDI